MGAIKRQARWWSKMLVVGWVLLALISPGNVALADGPDKPGAGGKAAPTTELQDGTKGNAALADAAAGETCTEDTSQAHFQAGTANGVDVSISPGDIVLDRDERLDQPGSTYDDNLDITLRGDTLAQSFVPAVTGRLSRAMLMVSRVGTHDTPPSAVVSLHADNGGVPGAVLAGTTIADIRGYGTLKEAFFHNSPVLSAGATYYISVRAACTCDFAGARHGDPYPGGSLFSLLDGRTQWQRFSEDDDLVFETYMFAGYRLAGEYVSAVKDSNPPPGATAAWSNLNWSALTPEGTSLKFQVAGSDSPTGPFDFVGPDGTPGSFFLTSGASLSQFNGNRYLKYKAYLGTMGPLLSPSLSSVGLCLGLVTSGPTCQTDGSQSDFQPGTANGVDLTSSPGDVTLLGSAQFDQPGSSYDDNLDITLRGDTLAQSFVPAVTRRLARVMLMVSRAGTHDTPPSAVVSLHADNGGVPGAVLAGTTIADIRGYGTLKEAFFHNSPVLSAGATYYISVRAPCSCDIAGARHGDPYPGGSLFSLLDGRTQWQRFSEDDDLVFETYMLRYEPEGEYVSAVKDSNPPPGAIAAWSNLNWSALTPEGTSLRFQVAGSDSPTGPFSFIGPDGTANSFYTAGSLTLPHLAGKRYMRYRAVFTSTRLQTPRLFHVTICFSRPAAPSPLCENITWKNARNVLVSSASLRKSRNTTAWDAGAVSSRAIGSSDGAVDAQVFYINERFAFGLSSGDTNQHIADVDFALQADPGTRKISVLESGAVKGVFGAYSEGDVLRVAVQRGVVGYYHNGNLIYSSNKAPVYPLLLDSALFNVGAQIFNGRICGQTLKNVPDAGVNAPAAGASQVGQRQQFVTTCSDPDGWRNVRTIDFKLARGPEDEEPVLWLVFDQDRNLIRFYDPDTGSWSEGSPGEDRVLSNAYADLRLAGTRVQGRGPTAPEVDITWDVAFKPAAAGSYKQYLRIEDDEGQSTLLDEVGTWSVAGPCDETFADVGAADYFHDAVYYLNCRGVVSGYGESFRPYANTTRGQMAKIIVLAKGLELVDAATPRFHDVPTSDPFFSYVETAAANNIVSGYDDGSFRPYAEVTRGQLSKIVVVAMGWSLAKPAETSFLDVPREHPFYVFVETAVEHGIVGGYDVAGGREFRPGNNATRGQIARIVYLAVGQ